MHSEGYLKRQFNPKSYVKCEAEHIAHFKLRLKERFNIEIDTEQYYRILANLKKEGVRIYGINCGNAIYSVTIYGKEVWIIYGKKNDKIADRLKTALLPFKGYIVPDKLSRRMNHTMFSSLIKDQIEEFKALSKELDLNNKKAFFTRGLHHLLAAGALLYKLHGNENNLKLIGIAVHCIEDRFLSESVNDYQPVLEVS